MSGAVSGGGAGAGPVLRQGHLRKLKTMKKKFFVLRGEGADGPPRLEYYESEKKYRAGAAPRRVLQLPACYNVTRRLDLKQKHVIALFTREEQFCVVADNEPELHAWLADMLRLHHATEPSEDLLHPIQHVWQVNVQKKGLGAVKNIHGLYNLCLTDKTLTLVKIKSHNNVISELGIPERVEYALKNIRRCGDSECFFYMEVGRQTTTGAGELWMHSDDTNIAQSMHSTIYLAMRNCAKESENERDHIMVPKNEGGISERRQTYPDSARGRPVVLTSERALCAGSCMAQCVCAGATLSIDDSAAIVPLACNAEYQANNPLTEKEGRVIKHHRTVSLPTGCPLYQEPPLRIVHERTRSAPLTGEELDTVVERAAHGPAKLNGADKKSTSARRASTGTRLSKLSPAHSKNTGPMRTRSESMPSQPCSSYNMERLPPRHVDHEGAEAARDETDAVTEWYRTPRIPEEPDLCDISKELHKSFISDTTSGRTGSIQHSRTSSIGADEESYLAMAPREPSGYLTMGPSHDPLGGLISASSGSVCSGTPSTDPRFSEYQLDPATSHISAESRPPRAYSVGSRPAPRAECRHRAYSVGARARPAPPPAPAPPHARPRASAEDLMLLDFTRTPAHKPSIPVTPPHGSYSSTRAVTEEYVAMSPSNAGYVEMRIGDLRLQETRPGEKVPSVAESRSSGADVSTPIPTPAARTPDGYVEMTYSKSRPIAIAAARLPPPTAASPDDRFRRKLESRGGHGSQIFEFSGSLESPLSPDTLEDSDHLATVREAEERPGDPTSATDAPAAPGAVSCSPAYVTLAGPRRSADPPDPPANPTANKALADNIGDKNACGAAVVVAGGGACAARFSVSGAAAPAPLNYAALDLERPRAHASLAPRQYTQIDFIRSEKLHAAGDAT